MGEFEGSDDKSSIVHSTHVPDSLRWEHFLNIFNHQFFDYKREAEFVHKWIGERNYKVNDILDMGCGIAYHLLHLRKMGYSCVGIDRDAGSLEYTQRFVTGKDIPLITGDILQEPASEIRDRFDLVLAKHLSFTTDDTETLLRNARRMLKADGPKLIVIDFITTNGEGLERNIFSMDTHVEEGFNIARVNNMELATGTNKYNWQGLYLLKQKGCTLDIKVDSGSLWFHTIDDVMSVLDKVDVSVDRSRSKSTSPTRLSGITIYGKFRD